METFRIDNITCRILGEEGPCFLYGLDSMEDTLAEDLYNRVSLATDKPFMLAAFQTEDWNACFSPWEAEGIRKGDTFAGKGPETLQFITDKYMPYIREHYPKAGEMLTAGYSLSAIWALWAAYECEALAGCVSCSGSLWFPKWDEYMRGHRMQAKGPVYLSLGVKEEKTRNPQMSRVGDVTRGQYDLLQQDANVTDCTLEWNPGGHFADVCDRVSKGIMWILDRR